MDNDRENNKKLSPKFDLSMVGCSMLLSHEDRCKAIGQLLKELKESEDERCKNKSVDKQLEILKIIKKHLTVELLGESSMYDIVCDLGESDSGDNYEFNLVKEWLEEN